MLSDFTTATDLIMSVYSSLRYFMLHLPMLATFNCAHSRAIARTEHLLLHYMAARIFSCLVVLTCSGCDVFNFL